MELNYRFLEFEVVVLFDFVVMIVWNNFKNGFKGLVVNFKDIVK